jgi:hypothetical protein
MRTRAAVALGVMLAILGVGTAFGLRATTPPANRSATPAPSLANSAIPSP